MKLVETEIEHITDEDPERPSPPRPERRRVYMSLAVTLTVLIATVITVYVTLPPRHNTIIEAVIAENASSDEELDLTKPTAAEVRAWSVGLFGPGIPWPETGDTIIGARSFTVLRRKVGIVHYQIAGQRVSLAVTRARDAPIRTVRVRDDGRRAIKYRRRKWTFIAVGPEASADAWLSVLDAPKAKK